MVAVCWGRNALQQCGKEEEAAVPFVAGVTKPRRSHYVQGRIIARRHAAWPGLRQSIAPACSGEAAGHRSGSEPPPPPPQLPEKRHPAFLHPKPPTPRHAHSSPASQHPRWRLRARRQRVGARGPPAVGVRSHTRVLQPRAAPRGRGCGGEPPPASSPGPAGG